MIVVDASVVVDFLTRPDGTAGDELAARLQRREVVAAPHLIDVEVAQVLRRHVFAKRSEGAMLRERVDDLVALPIQRFPHRHLVGRAFELRDNVTVYDGVYLALAELLDWPLLTGDASLAAVPSCRATVEVMHDP